MEIEIDRKKLLWFLVSTAIIVVTAYFANISRIIEALRSARIDYLIPAFIFGLSNFLIWSYTWYSFLDAMEISLSYGKAVRMFMSGHFMNSVTPLGQFGGEPLMAYIISKHTNGSTEEGFSAVLSADIVNAVPMFTFVVGGAVFLLMLESSLNQTILRAVYIALLTTVIGGGLVYLLWFESGAIESRLSKFMHWITGKIGYGEKIAKSVEERLEEVQNAFSTIGNSKTMLFRTAAVAHVGFLTQVLCLGAILMSLEVVTLETIQLTPLYFTVTLSSFANFSPTPGGSGTFEVAMAGLLSTLVGVPFSTAFLAAIIFRLTTYWPGLVLGWLSLNTLEEV